MSSPTGYTCRICGARHEELPMSYRSDAPDYWSDELARDETSDINSDLCVIRGEYFFVQANLHIPVEESETDFDWGVWVSLSQDNFDRMVEVWEQPGRESEPPYFGWLSTELPLYGTSTLNVKTYVHTSPVGEKPYIEIEASDHPLAVEVHGGITIARVQEIAELLMHG